MIQAILHILKVLGLQKISSPSCPLARSNQSEPGLCCKVCYPRGHTMATPGYQHLLTFCKKWSLFFIKPRNRNQRGKNGFSTSTAVPSKVPRPRKSPLLPLAAALTRSKARASAEPQHSMENKALTMRITAPEFLPESEVHSIIWEKHISLSTKRPAVPSQARGLNHASI